MATWSYMLAEELLAAFESCGLLPECARVWPGCRPPDATIETCPNSVWVTFTEGADGPVSCETGPAQTARLTVWMRECTPGYDDAGTLPDHMETVDRYRQQAELRTDLLHVAVTWVTQQTLVTCYAWTGTVGAWTCEDPRSGCTHRTLTINLRRDWP